MKAIVLERNKLVARRIARIWSCAGMTAICAEDPKDLEPLLPGAALLGADAFDADAARSALRGHDGLRAALWTAEPLDRLLRRVADEPRVCNIFGRASFEATPREWELALVARRLAHRSADAVPFSAFVAWGHTGFRETVASSAERDAAVARVARYIERLGLPRRVGEMFGELAHELLMNALYDAPVDRHGRARHSHDRKAQVELPPAEAAQLRVACDGVRLAIQVTDPFGRLERRHVFEGLLRGLRGQMDQSQGGAGLGMAVCLGATVALVFDVVPGQRTEVTGVFDLDLNLREFRGQAKSVHYFG